MRKQMIGSICLGGLSMIGVLLWEPSTRAADEPKIINIVPGPDGPVFDEPAVTIGAGHSIKWVPKKPKVPHHLVEDDTNAEITKEFNSAGLETATQTFGAARIIKYHCEIHPDTMKGTITVQ